MRRELRFCVMREFALEEKRTNTPMLDFLSNIDWPLDKLKKKINFHLLGQSKALSKYRGLRIGALAF